MLTEQLLIFLLWIPVILGQSQVELDLFQERIELEESSCNCKNLQGQFNNLQLKLDRILERLEEQEACFDDLGSDNCMGSKSGLIGIVEAIRVDGGWGPFSDWSQCSATCGGGVQVKNRICNNPVPKNGGKQCTGEAVEQRACNAHQCYDSCKESQCSSENGCLLVKNSQLMTLPQLNKEFFVSFEFQATEYISGCPKTSRRCGWQSVIQFTEGGDCCRIGQRIPGFWVKDSGQLYPRFSVNGNGDYGIMTTKNYSLNQWHSVKFSQTLKNGKYMYRVVIDGEDVIGPMENKQPQIFSNVKVTAANTHSHTQSYKGYQPLKGSLRNLVINTDSPIECEGRLCPVGYEAISQNLDGAGKDWSQPHPLTRRTKEECAAICNKRIGCTAFEFAEGLDQHGACGTYTGGSANVQADQNRLSVDSNWRSCVKKPGCSIGTEFRGSCYEVVETKAHWDAASQDCSARGGALASIPNREVNDFLAPLVKESTWIGGNDIQQEGVWMWSSGEAMDFTAWHSGEPNNNHNEDCLVLGQYHWGSKWNDDKCAYEYQYICRFPIRVAGNSGGRSVDVYRGKLGNIYGGKGGRGSRRSFYFSSKRGDPFGRFGFKDII